MMKIKQRKRGTFREWLSITRAKAPKRFVLLLLLLINILFFLAGSLVISYLAPDSVGAHGFGASLYYAVTMVLDAGCISYIIEDVGTSGLALIIACVVIVIIGMVIFTGAVIGYMTTWIGDFIDSSNSGKAKVRAHGHTILLNWNNRASEIINDLLYSEHRETVVVLSSHNINNVKAEIEQRLYDTIESENSRLRQELTGLPLFTRAIRWRRECLRRSHVDVIVREGDTFATKLLNDISVKHAKAVIVLGDDIQNKVCKYSRQEKLDEEQKGNSNLIKTLIQVADLTSAADSADDQQLIVEVDDPWTMSLLERVIAHKRAKGKCNIVPISADKILGQILSQFSVMPELNMIYEELFSNKGAAFYSVPETHQVSDRELVTDYMSRHSNAIPLTCMEDEGEYECFFLASKQADIINSGVPSSAEPYSVKLNPNYWISMRNVIILGHNSKCNSIMDGFNAFRNEWNFSRPDLIEKYGTSEILNITVIDDEASLKKRSRYSEYPYVKNIVQADIFDREKIMAAINEIVDNNVGDTSILILSDDDVANEDIDSAALMYLIYVQDIIQEHKDRDSGFDINSIDVIVEILDPKNHDIVYNYSRSNIVISNRYISKMATQISEKKSIFSFYSDILTYDEANVDSYSSKELYVKPVGEFFAELPAPCTPYQLIRAVYAAGPEDNKSIVLGYVKHDNTMVIFSGDQTQSTVKLAPDDKIILYSNH